MYENPAELNDFTTVTEGKATILFPKDQVFYNPAQQFNRDLSVAIIRAWSESLITKAQLRKIAWEQRRANQQHQPTDQSSVSPVSPPKNDNIKPPPQRKITVLEALSATGLRAIRYALEIPAINTVLANDVSASAVEAISRNITHNNLPPELVQPTCSDANALMYSHVTNRVDVVDLDPYGTATPFIDAAIQAIASDGLLCVTCTDMSVLAGIGYPEKCFANYGGSPVKQEYTHEVVGPFVRGGEG
jgi:tRNA (guanine26-N2/guanine27-N2)-dimethyltransferase